MDLFLNKLEENISKHHVRVSPSISGITYIGIKCGSRETTCKFYLLYRIWRLQTSFTLPKSSPLLSSRIISGRVFLRWKNFESLKDFRGCWGHLTTFRETERWYVVRALLCLDPSALCEECALETQALGLPLLPRRRPWAPGQLRVGAAGSRACGPLRRTDLRCWGSLSSLASASLGFSSSRNLKLFGPNWSRL